MADINRATDITDEEVADVFEYHKWTDEQVAAGKEVREALGTQTRRSRTAASTNFWNWWALSDGESP